MPPKERRMPSLKCSAKSAMVLCEYMLVTAGSIVGVPFVVSYI